MCKQRLECEERDRALAQRLEDEDQDALLARRLQAEDGAAWQVQEGPVPMAMRGTGR